MKVSELIRLVQKKGAKFKAHGARHDVYINPNTGDEAQIPRHPAKELKKGIADGILKDLGLK